ncbi:MAG: TatD family hydrolase [Patescibacteria group bacterium]
MRLIDTHVHLNDPAYAQDLDEVLGRARDAGVERMVVVGYDLPSSARAAALAERYPQIRAAVGISPHEAETWCDEAGDELARLARRAGVVALGEIGLDHHYVRDPAGRARQTAAFAGQLDLACALGLPVVVHDREAHAEVLALLRARGASLAGGVMHCFTGSEETARAAWDLGLRVSFAGPLTFQNAARTRAVAAKLPPECLLVETDAPYLTPHPYRGRRNEPCHVALVAAALAEARGAPLAELAEGLWRNAELCFGFGAEHPPAGGK